MPALRVEQMTVEEKLRTMETLWEDLIGNEDDIPVPQWHKDLLDERHRLMRAGKAKFTSWETAKKRIASRLP